MPCFAHLTLAELLDHFLTHEEYTSIAAPVNAGKPLEEYPQRETLKLKGVPYTHGYSVDAAKRAMTEARQMGRAVRHSPRAQPSSSGNTHPRTSAPHVPAPGRTSWWHAHPPWVFWWFIKQRFSLVRTARAASAPRGLHFAPLSV